MNYHDKSVLLDLKNCGVKNWFNEFNRGRRSLKDEVREGRPKTAVVSDNIDAVRELIVQYRFVT